ncbi:MAG TPA: family 1 encapsulin nanocompartment shell protein [Actinomycetota bacterium]|nr:family 1 encapsulin nanocompartment shell protein [Actinomycetota bacterium]
MSHLLRGQAPITDAGWALIDGEATARLAPALAARALVDFSGPNGWGYSATNLGRVVPLEGVSPEGVAAVQRRVLPLVELRAAFAVSRAELADYERGARDIDLDALDDAARLMAVAENGAVFHGLAGAGIVGITQATPHAVGELGTDAEAYPRVIAGAVETLKEAGIGGPYAVALRPEPYLTVVETAEHAGVLLLDHLRTILGGPIVWSPGVTGAVVLSQRGGDFLFESGEDLSIGYSSHDAGAVALYLEESFSFRVATPEAAVALA